MEAAGFFVAGWGGISDKILYVVGHAEEIFKKMCVLRGIRKKLF